MHSTAEVLAYAVEDGGVWIHHSGEKRSRLLYRHESEPFRVVVSALGGVASGADDGSVMAYDSYTGAIHRARASHTARVYQLHWRDDQLLTSSFDGTLRRWTANLEINQLVRTDEPIRDMELWREGWAANIGATRLWIHDDETDVWLDTGPSILDLAVSDDGRFIGAVVGMDLIVYDSLIKAIAAIRVADTALSCIHFADTVHVFVCGSSGEVFHGSVESLSFVQTPGAEME